MNNKEKSIDGFQKKMLEIPIALSSVELPDFFHFIDNARFAINFVDKNGVIVYANQEARESRIIPPEFVGRSLYDLKKFGIILNPAAIKVIESCKVNIGEVTQYSGRTFMSITVPVIDDRKQLEGVIALTCDIADVYNFIIASSSWTRHIQAPQSSTSEMFPDSNVVTTTSPEMLHILKMADKIAQTSAPVLILGESGTGKEVLAKRIHSKSNRNKKRLLAINCGAIPPALMESELFGYEKGAFTGAWRNTPGLFEEVDDGTLFLDEIGDLDLQLQVKLLRVLQEGKLRRVGGRKDIDCHVRIIAATNKDLPVLVRQGLFRSDLFYRLSVFTLSIPPLRNRRQDLMEFIPFFLEKYNKAYGFSRYLTGDAWAHLLAYDWPGNVRELSNTLERLVVLAETNEITSEDVTRYLQCGVQKHDLHLPLEETKEMTLPEATEILERKMLTDARAKYGTYRAMANHLGIYFSTIARKMRKYGIE